MCFHNDAEKLKKFRSRKRAITVWKKGNPDEHTGLVITSRGGKKVVWELGKIAVPDKIHKPLSHQRICTHGLYFHTSKPDSYNYSYGLALIEAKVYPKDIIAVSNNSYDTDEEMICCVKAKVTKAPNPDQRKMRIKYLKVCLVAAKARVSERRIQVKQWQAEIELWQDREIEDLEATQNMQDELKRLVQTA